MEGKQSTKCWSCLLKSIAVVVAVSFVSLPTGVMAQSTAQISGVVTDQSSAILPGVEVKVTQTDTGITRSAVTNETGSYTLPNLPIGPYRLEAALPGLADRAGGHQALAEAYEHLGRPDDAEAQRRAAGR